MDAAQDNRRQLGQLMVDEGFLTEEQLSLALAEQSQSGQPLGKVLVDLGFVSPGAVANALAEQHGGLLRTEYGTSAGLTQRAQPPPIRTDSGHPASPALNPEPSPQAAQPAPLGAGLRLAQPAGAGPVAAEPEAPSAPPEPAPAPVPEPEPEPEQEQEPDGWPEPDPQPEPEPPTLEVEETSAADAASATLVEELEAQLRSVLTERDALAQSFNELQVRLSEAAHTHEAGISAEFAERVNALESSLQAAIASREELEQAHRLSAARIGELEAQLQSAAAELGEAEVRVATQIGELNRELHELRTAAAEREGMLEEMATLEAELEQLRMRDDFDDGSQGAETEVLRSQLQAVVERNDAVVGELTEALHAASTERNSAVERAETLGRELASLRARIDDVVTERDAALAGRAGTDPEARALREQLAARERRLAESVAEIAKMNREHRALLQLVERQFQLEEATTAVPETKGEASHVLFVPTATGYTLEEQDGAAPEAGDVVELGTGRFVVRRLGPSPLPGPRRRCAYLERA